MALRTKKGTRSLILVALWLPAGLVAQEELRFEVRRHHWFRAGAGTLVVSPQGISFREQTKHNKVKHALELRYQDIQELKLFLTKLTVVTYQDRKWLLGLDKKYEFRLPSGQSFQRAYALLKDRLDQRFVAALADPDIQPLWEIPVKLAGRIQGSEGLLQVGADRIVYKTERPEQSRTWRYEDIENISSSGPFQLTLTTYERARTHYGSLKVFNFQLKQRLEERRYDILWRRLNQSKGLQPLTSLAPDRLQP